MYQRHILNELLAWSQKPNRKPLVLRGARQVGKTTAVTIFSKRYKQFILLNLEKQEHKQLFESGYTFPDIITAIFYISGMKSDIEDTLIFIDEIQNSPKAVAQLRYFYEETPHYSVIAAGSLLESLIDNQISFPVGRVEYLAMRPCSFIEFLNATGETQSSSLIENIDIPDFAHDKLLKLFNRYTLIGGMPEIIAQYKLNKDLISLDPIYESLLNSYADDIEKYARNQSQTQHIRHILKTGFRYAGHRIKFEGFGESAYRSREMSEAFRTLEKAMLCELIYPITQPQVPILPDYKKSPRLQWLDTGLVNYASGIQKDILLSKDILQTYKGTTAEHIVGQEMHAYNHKVSAQRNFWTREKPASNAEVDYIVQIENLVVPIEVKSGTSGKLRSLHQYMTLAPHNISIKISSSKYSVENVKVSDSLEYKLIHVPFYLISKIKELVLKEAHFITQKL